MADKRKKKGKHRDGDSKKPRGSGKFQKGNTAGAKSKGKHPQVKKKLAFAEAFKTSVTLQDIKDITKKLVDEAKDGDIRAIQQILDRCLGKVKETTEITIDKDTQDFLKYMGDNYGGLPGD